MVINGLIIVVDTIINLVTDFDFIQGDCVRVQFNRYFPLLNAFIILIALALVLSTSAMAAEPQDEEVEVSDTTQETSFMSTPDSKKLHYSFQLGESSNGLQKVKPKYRHSDNTDLSAVAKGGVEYELNKTFSTRLSLGFQAQSERGEVEHDHQITDAMGQTFILVDKEMSYENIEAGIYPALIHNLRIGTLWNIRNIASVGYARGIEEYEVSMVTQQNDWHLLYNHNRYGLNSRREYERLSISYGIEAVVKIFVLSVEARHSVLNTTSLKNTSSIAGEYFFFDKNSYDFASYKKQVDYVVVGFGMRF